MKRLTVLSLLATTLVGFAMASAPLPVPKVVNADLIRVGISTTDFQRYDVDRADIATTGPLTLTTPLGEILWTAAQAERAQVTFTPGEGFYLSTTYSGRKGPYPGPLRLQPNLSPKATDRVTLFHISRKGGPPSYRGALELLPVKGNRFMVINILPLQEYLQAVVPNELPIRYGEAAVQAQAVATRNYAVRPREKFWTQFDICDSQYCQAYYGAQTETPATNRILMETEGLFALYQGEPILALYSAANGGHSEDYSNAFSDPKTHQFPGTPLPYLKAVPDFALPKTLGDLTTEKGAKALWTTNTANSYERESPYFRWTRTWRAADLAAGLNANLQAVSSDPTTQRFVQPRLQKGQSIGSIKNIRVTCRGASGKAMTVVIEGTRGTCTLQKEYVIRKAFAQNGKILPSANAVFTVGRGPKGMLQSLKVQGGGFGHGVGMSQHGASRMAALGKTFDQILRHYYPGITLGTLPLAPVAEPLQTTFVSPKSQGVLCVSQPGTVQLNGQSLQATGRTPVALKAHQENHLVVYPGTKAWIELPST
jgi:stage II sporulation protein D